MRLTQLGHQVPRRNSRISVPSASRSSKVNVPSRFAAPSEKLGAREPISRVSVLFFISTSTLSHIELKGQRATRYGDGARPDFCRVRYNSASRVTHSITRGKPRLYLYL